MELNHFQIWFSLSRKVELTFDLRGLNFFIYLVIRMFSNLYVLYFEKNNYFLGALKPVEKHS